MKKILSSFLLTTLLSFGENGQPLSVGSTVLPEITFSVGEPNFNEQSLENFRVTNFRENEFEGQVLLVMYHAAW